MNHANHSLGDVSLNIQCDHCGKNFSYPLAAETFVCPHCAQSMTRIQAIESFLRTAMSATFSYDRKLIRGSSRLNEIGDSMGTIELLMRLETDFGISIDHDDIEELENVAAVSHYIHRKVSQKLKAAV
ncbi:MAG: acyl carrier protein [Planctomycetaceae bacterium]|nr:acyl carrier protein [Planctomycetaceae bacterium]